MIFGLNLNALRLLYKYKKIYMLNDVFGASVDMTAAQCFSCCSAGHSKNCEYILITIYIYI